MKTRLLSLLVCSAALSSAALSSAAGLTYSVVVNGQVAPGQAIVVGGQTYVPLSALKLLGVGSTLKGNTLTLRAAAQPGGVTPGGANQRVSLEGCTGETLFNGIWRLTVRSVRPVSRNGGQQKGYALNLEWKNGTSRTVDALNTGLKSVTLVMADGNTLTSEEVQNLSYKSLPQATGLTLELPFYAESAQSAAGLAAPSKLLLEIDPRVVGSSSLSEGVAYSTPNPSFRVRLDCQK